MATKKASRSRQENPQPVYGITSVKDARLRDCPTPVVTGPRAAARRKVLPSPTRKPDVRPTEDSESDSEGGAGVVCSGVSKMYLQSNPKADTNNITSHTKLFPSSYADQLKAALVIGTSPPTSPDVVTSPQFAPWQQSMATQHTGAYVMTANFETSQKPPHGTRPKKGSQSGQPGGTS